MRSSCEAACFGNCFGGRFGDCFGCGAGDLTDEDGFNVVALNFGANLLKRSLSVMGGRTRGNDTLTAVVDLVRDLRGAYRM